MPAVPAPKNSGIRSPVEVKLKPNWRYDASRRTFVSKEGEEFDPRGELPKRTKIVYTVPALARADESALTDDEKNLSRHMQIIFPHEEKPSKYLKDIRSWESVEEAHVAPDISLPSP